MKTKPRLNKPLAPGRRPHVCVCCLQVGAKSVRIEGKWHCEACYRRVKLGRPPVPVGRGICEDCGGACSAGAKLCKLCYAGDQTREPVEAIIERLAVPPSAPHRKGLPPTCTPQFYDPPYEANTEENRKSLPYGGWYGVTRW